MKRKKRKFIEDGVITISPRKIYVFLVLVVAVVLIIKFNPLPPRETHGEYGKIGPAEVEDFLPYSNSNDENETAGEDASDAADEEKSSERDILSLVPDYSEVNRPTYTLNDNKPWFDEEDYARAESQYIELSDLDFLGRCGPCEASLGEDTLATDDRDFDLSNVTPSGWNQAQYEGIDNGGWLYNRCHLIMYAVCKELTDEPRNLITGTRYMNVEGQYHYAEKAVQNWLIRKANGGRVLYRATPIFDGAELVCRGVLIEAGDVPTRGSEFHICQFCYNVQPGIEIDYFSGKSWRSK